MNGIVRRTDGDARGRQLTRPLLIGILFLGLIFCQQRYAPSVAGSGWSISSAGGCNSGAQIGSAGHSVFSWNGQPSNAWGSSYAYLWFDNGGTWARSSTGYDKQYGTDTYTYAVAQASPNGGQWTVTGGHDSNFGGGGGSYGNVWWC